jgi:N-acetylmuramic acid 6-phosphate etherase
MVDLRVVNDKLVDRAVRMVCDITGAQPEVARKKLEEAGRDVKVAVLMIEHDIDAATARHRLREAGGRLAAALTSRQPES